MHPRNYYKDNRPDFATLAQARPSLKPFLVPSPSTTHAYTLDFSNPDALKELTCALLENDFGIRVELPAGKLVPTLTLRLNYIHWVEDLLSTNGTIPKDESVFGIDIGTGASCIYPLLGAKLNGWRFLATEIDQESVTYALGNVQRNAMGDKIKVVHVPEDTLLLGAVEGHLQYHFCMCNPPFFKDGEERYGGVARSGSRPLPSTVSTGDLSETITAGGEVEFVRRMIKDSLKLKMVVRWYTSMLGKKSSLTPIKAELRKCEVPTVTTTEFVQGRTRRWGVAWSFDDSLQHKQAMGHGSQKRPHPLEMVLSNSIFLSTAEGLAQAAEWVQTTFRELQIEYSVVTQTGSCVELQCNTTKNTWMNQRRKKRLLQQLEKVQHIIAENQPPQGLPEPESVVLQRQKLTAELASLHTPCKAAFLWTIALQEAAPSHVPKRVACEEPSQLGIVMKGEWLEGDDRDVLHQILQYLTNALSVQ